MRTVIHVPPALHAARWHPATYQVIACVLASMTLSFALGAAFSICGQWLGALGANPLQVSVTLGFAIWLGAFTEAIARRLITSGKGYSPASLAGCAVALASLALAGEATSWTPAALLFIAAGVGAGLWESSQDYLLSATSHHVAIPSASTWHRALTQITFTWGALAMSVHLLSGDAMADGFTGLWWALPPAGAAALVAAIGPHGRSIETTWSTTRCTETRRLRLRLVGIAAMAMGLANFALLAYQRDIADPRLHAWLPALCSMGVTTAVLSAQWLRRILLFTGRRTDLILSLLALLYAPCAFVGGRALFALGMILWGGALGALHAWLSTTLSSSLPALTIPSRRTAAHLTLASAGLLGSALLGVATLKGPDIAALVAIALQAAGLLCLTASRPLPSAKELHK